MRKKVYFLRTQTMTGRCVLMKQQDFNLSLIRACAVASVIGVHFFLNCGFYDVPSGGYAMMGGIFVRTLLMVCVPLFLLLTGYLQGEKPLSLSYYKKLPGFLATYVLASLFCQAFRIIALDGSCSPLEWIRGIFWFNMAPYAWYVELYIGLFLLVPFLNVIWRNLPDKRWKLLLVCTILFLSIAPSINVLFYPFGWKLIPEDWEALYPVAYYFTGCYFREFQPQYRRAWLLVLAFLAVLSGAILHVLQADGEPFGYFVLTYWNGACTFVSSACVFLLLRSIPVSSISNKIQRPIGLISSLSLPIFLVSWVPDQLVYGVLNASTNTVPQRFPWFFLTVFLVLLCSTCVAYVLVRLQALLGRLLSKFIQIGKKGLAH